MSTIPDSGFQHDAEEDVSLQQLSDAFARAMGNVVSADRCAELPAVEVPGQEGGAAAGDPAECGSSALGAGISADEAPPKSVGTEFDHDPCEISPMSILEAMLFVGNPASEPLTSQRAAELMRGVSPEEIPDLVDALNHRYTLRGCPYHIVSEGAGYRMTLRGEYRAVHGRFYGRVREARLSQVAIDVLAVVAYRQPITAEEVNQHRGRPCNQLLSQLVRRRLLRIQRDPGSPRVARYCTTDRFLGVFGLESLNDLPHSDDVDVK
jgi:segregation and condensation protein B